VENAAMRQKFVDLPRATSPFYHLPSYTYDEHEEHEKDALPNSGHKKACNTGAATAW